METVKQHALDDEPPIAFLAAVPSSPPPQRSAHALSIAATSQSHGTHEARPKKQKQKAQLEEKVKGHSQLPLSRVQKIMKTEHEIAMSSKEAVFLVTAAAEEFMKRFAIAGYREATEENRSVITQGDMANAAHKLSQYNFLEETIPRAMSITEALRLREFKQKQDAAALDPEVAVATVDEDMLSTSAIPVQSQRTRSKKERVKKEHAPPNERSSRRKSGVATAQDSVPSPVDSTGSASTTNRANGRSHESRNHMSYVASEYIDNETYYVPPQIDTTPPSPPSQPRVGRTIYSRNVDSALL